MRLIGTVKKHEIGSYRQPLIEWKCAESKEDSGGGGNLSNVSWSQTFERSRGEKSDRTYSI